VSSQEDKWSDKTEKESQCGHRRTRDQTERKEKETGNPKYTPRMSRLMGLFVFYNIKTHET
jgi:hypothetical protein